MKKKILALCDTETAYAARLADFLRETPTFPFEVRLFTRTQTLQEFLQEERADLLLISESACLEGYEREKDEPGDGVKLNQTRESVIVLNETGKPFGADLKNIRKYQPAEVILREIMCSYTGDENWEEGETAAGGRRMRLIGVYTPVGRCLQTTFALTLGQILARKGRTLYLNFESYSGLGRLMGREFKMDMTDLLYFYTCARDKLRSRLPGIVQNINGLDFLPPTAAYTELKALTGGQWLELFGDLEAAGGYDYLVLDLSENVEGLFDILRQCRRIYTITREDVCSRAKLEQYEQQLLRLDCGDVAGRTRKWTFPVFRRIPEDLTMLTCGDLAEYVRKLVREDLEEERDG